jgi:hypothetical protein
MRRSMGVLNNLKHRMAQANTANDLWLNSGNNFTKSKARSNISIIDE